MKGSDVPQFIGMDEAGYGPNLGPLVITVTAWPLAHDPLTCDVWQLLGDVVARTAAEAGAGKRIHVGDSKQVYSPSKGLAALETSVLTILGVAGIDARTFSELWQRLAVEFPQQEMQEPWFEGADIALPTCADAAVIDEAVTRFRECLNRCGFGPPHVRSDVVLTERFNSLVNGCGSKGRLLSSLSLLLLRRLWNPDDNDSTLVICDKHGGRNRYDELLADVLDGQMIFRMEESRARSVYRIGLSEIWFQTKAEVHFPVAVASLVSKYLRELAMLAFNRYWQKHLPDVKPTKGYPNDAKRFRSDVARKQAELGISEAIFWRQR